MADDFDLTTSINLSTLEVRSGGGKTTIEGYAARFDELSEEIAPGIRELFKPGAFAEALRSSDPVALFDHDTSKVLGRKSAGTLELREDARGLFVTIHPPETGYAREVVQLIQRGDVRGQSVRYGAYKPGSARWEFRERSAVRVVERVDALRDVGPVTMPAFPQTTVAFAVRSLAAYRDEQRELESAARRAALDALAVDSPALSW